MNATAQPIRRPSRRFDTGLVVARFPAAAVGAEGLAGSNFCHPMAQVGSFQEVSKTFSLVGKGSDRLQHLHYVLSKSPQGSSREVPTRTAYSRAQLRDR